MAGQNDAAMTYEPYLSTVRANPQAGKILATTLDYPMVMDTVGCAPEWLKANPKAAQSLANAYFDALEMIKSDPAKSNEIMGAAVKQTGEAFAKSAAYLRWQDKAANQKFFAGELQAFMKDSAAILLEAGVIRKAPDDYAAMYDASFIKSGYRIRPGQVCAGGAVTDSACWGDSGGPLVVKDGSAFVLLGVVSYGIGCGRIRVAWWSRPGHTAASRRCCCEVGWLRSAWTAAPVS